MTRSETPATITRGTLKPGRYNTDCQDNLSAGIAPSSLVLCYSSFSRISHFGFRFGHSPHLTRCSNFRGLSNLGWRKRCHRAELRGPFLRAACGITLRSGTGSCHGDGKTGLAVQATRLSVSVERDLRRPERLLGLRPAGRRAEAERPRGLVARHGHRARRAGRSRPGPRRPTK